MNRTNNGADTNVGKMLTDVLALALSVLVVWIINIILNVPNSATWNMLPVMLAFGAVFFVSNKALEVYDVTLFFYLDRILRKIIHSFVFAFIISYVTVFMSKNPGLDKRTYFIFLGVAFVFLLTSTLFYIRYPQKLNRVGVPNVAFVGKKNEFVKFKGFLKKTNIRYNFVGFVAYSADLLDTSDSEYVGSLENLENLIREHQIDQIYIMDNHSVTLDVVQHSIDLCVDMGVTIRVIVNTFKRRRSNSYVSTVGTYPIVTYHTVTLNRSEEIVKRIMDFFGGLIGIILSSPIMLITAIAIKLDSPGPVFFKQTRVGKNGRHFVMYKFRSMCINADSMKAELMEQNEVKDGGMFKMKDDPRVTRVGKFIRKTSIDELPQFFNIVAGSMSLVGTRPPTLDEVEKYDTTQWRRISIKPGLTGMWQVSGRSSITDFDEVVRMDTEYIDNWSIMLDIKLLFQTVLSVFARKGAY